MKQVIVCKYCRAQKLRDSNIRLLTDNKGRPLAGTGPDTIRVKCNYGHIFSIPRRKK